MSSGHETKYAIFIVTFPTLRGTKHLPRKVFAFGIQRYTHYRETGDGPE